MKTYQPVTLRLALEILKPQLADLWFQQYTCRGFYGAWLKLLVGESGVQFDWGKATMKYSLLSSQNVLNHNSWMDENDPSEKPANLSGCQYHN